MVRDVLIYPYRSVGIYSDHYFIAATSLIISQILKIKTTAAAR